MNDGNFDAGEYAGVLQEEMSFDVLLRSYGINALTDEYIMRKLFFMIKRMFDVCCGLFGCMFVVPAACLIKMVYMLSGDHAPIMYTQTRIGFNGIPFKMYKFRTMVPDADKILKEMLKEEKWRREWEKDQKFEKDPRITKIGNILRKTSMDELPQMLNVLKGEMSLIGPRPLVENELKNHGGIDLYYKVKPGITGWWACNGRSDTNYNERLRLEYYYVKNCSLGMDLMCIFKTIAVVISRKGAK